MRHDIETTKEIFIKTLAETASVRRAAEHAQVNRTTVYDWRRDDPEFAAAWLEAKEIGADILESEAVRRAVEGTEKPVFFKGEQCGTVREYSDQLLAMLLRAAKPDTYRERIEHSVSEDTAELIRQARQRSPK